MEKTVVFTENGVCMFEHSIPVEKQTCDKLALFIKKEKNRIKRALKDFHIDHRLSADDGVSFAGRLVKSGSDPVEEAEKLSEAHKKFLNWLTEASKETEESKQDVVVDGNADGVKKFSDFVRENSDNEEEEFLLYAGMCALEQIAHHFGGKMIIIC